MTEIAIPIRPINFQEGLKLLQQVAAQNVSYAEIWCDRINPEDLKKLIDSKPEELKLILNLKDANEKGGFTGSLQERVQILEQFKVDYIDLPFRDDQTLMSNSSANIILSFHDFEKTPTLTELQELIEKMRSFNPSIIKIATQVNSEKDMTKLFQLQMNNPSNSLIVIGMGDKAKSTRTTAPMFNQPFTFACLNQDSKTASGQLTADELKEEWVKLKLTD